MTMAGRPMEFCPETALEAAMHQFWAAGYGHTSLQDLLQAMNLSKSSLYQTFGGKQLLFRKCLARYTQQITMGLRDMLARAPSGLGFLRAFLHSVVDETRSRTGRRGCLVMNTASELAQREPEIAEDVTRSIDEFRAVLIDAIKRAQREGAIRGGRDPRQLASFLVSSMSGLKTQAKAGADAETLEGIIQITLKALA